MEVFILACAKSNFGILDNIMLFHGYDNLWTTQGPKHFCAFNKSRETEMGFIHQKCCQAYLKVGCMVL